MASGAAPDLTSPPAWLREVETSVVTNSQLLIYGNVRDEFLIPNGSGGWLFRGIQESLWWCLQRIGYPVMLRADIVDGISMLPQTDDGEAAAKRLLRQTPERGGTLSLDALYRTLERTANQGDDDPFPGAMVIDYAARLVRSLPQLDPGHRPGRPHGKPPESPRRPPASPDHPGAQTAHRSRHYAPPSST
jgi:ATP-dependent Clp protease ATP-binding subunit ClpB